VRGIEHGSPTALKSHVRSILGVGIRRKSFFFISGSIISIPFTVYAKTLIYHLSTIMPIFNSRLFSTAIFTPFLEEFAKAYPLLYRKGDSERSFFTQGLLVGIGFGIAELLIYILRFGVPVYIRLSGVLFHTLNTSITAYGIAKNRPWLYLIAVTLHLLNNLSAIYGLIWLVAEFPLLLATFSITCYLYMKASPVNLID